MGNNSSKFDQDAHYAAKTKRQLEDEIKAFEAWLQKRDHPTLREHLAHLKLKLAERIGRKGTS